jgi:CRISPR-associated protein Csc3
MTDDYLQDENLSEEADEITLPDEAEAKRRQRREPRVLPSPRPMFETLFAQSIDQDDMVLKDFAQYVIGPLSDYFGNVSAKGGAFFRKKAAENARNTERYQRDQTLRGHLVNGMLPARRIAWLLHDWDAKGVRHWSEDTDRLFIAGYMLHDFTKIPAVKQSLKAAGFQEMEAPSQRQMPTLERIFIDWCERLGLNAFLQPLGGPTFVLHDVIYVALNTQQFSGTAHAPALLPNTRLSSDIYMLAAEVSHLADLLAYVAPTPRALVAHDTIQEVIGRLAFAPTLPQKVVGRLVYHHVAENRGLLLNLIHNAAIEALRKNNQREPLLFAPSGVVYLERHDAPPMPAPADLTTHIVGQIRQLTGARMVEMKKGVKLGKDGLRTDQNYNDLFNLRQLISVSPRLTLLIRSNAPQYIEKMKAAGYPGSADLPAYSTASNDPRTRQMAEWASLLEIHVEDRYPKFHSAFVAQVLESWGLSDLAAPFETIRTFKPEQRDGTGIRYHWYWAAVYALSRNPVSPESVLEWLEESAQRLIALLPQELPESARANEETWIDLADYIGHVLTLSGEKGAVSGDTQELKRYTRSKTGRGGAVCALCGSSYVTRKQAETAVAFQPGVYTARVRIGASDNKRSICSICGLEQLLRQLFVENLDTGGTAEGQRIRYLAFYPSYFFTPETLKLVQRVYHALQNIRISDKDFRYALQTSALTEPTFWQRLDPFLIRPLENDSRRVLRYSPDVQATFLMAGFRGFNDPTDSESWILPAFFALVLPICLDVKVIASESGVPLLLEADELPETVWFDGAHAAIQALVRTGRLNVDEVLPALTRLAAAYLIHLDTEYEPPKENWQRFPPIAHALMESSLYVFHYLKKQERDGQTVSAAQVRRYVEYADSIFAVQGDVLMSHAKELVTIYRQFYRAKNIGNANSILRPLSVVADALLVADPRLFGDADSLVEVAYGELYRFMDRVSRGLADGRFPKGVSAQEREQAMRTFCEKFVKDVFIGAFNRDVAALRGKQLNLLRSAVEVLYRNAQQEEWAAQGRPADDESDADSETAES